MNKDNPAKPQIDPADFYADIHVHATTFPFLVKEITSPWHNYDKTKSWKEKTMRTTKLTRGDLTKLMDVNMRLIVLSFVTIERYIPSKTLSSPFLMASILGMDREKLRRVLSNQPFKMFKEEFEMFKSFLKDPNSDREAVIVKNYAHMVETLKDPNKLAVVLSIEGSHNIGFEYSDENFPVEHKRANQNRIERAEFQDEALVNERVKFLKDNHFFIFSLCHFVYNQLASQPKAAELTGIKKILHNPFVSLTKKMGEVRGLTYLGYYMVERCYENNIIIDVKHCDAVSRHQIYQIAEKYGKPVVATHVACSGRKTNFHFHQLIHKEDQPRDRQLAEKFNPWDINMHDYDIIQIYRSGGLFGLILDERVLGSRDEIKRANAAKDPARLVYNQIEHVYTVLKNEGYPPHTCFDILCMGADHDGLIDPINTVPTVMEYRHIPGVDNEDSHKLDYDLIRLIRTNYDQFKESGLSPEEIVRKIMRENVMRFMAKNFV